MYKCNIVDKNLFNVLCSTFKVWKKTDYASRSLSPDALRFTGLSLSTIHYLLSTGFMLFTIYYRLFTALFDLIDVFCPADHHEDLAVLDFIVCRHHLDPVRQGISDRDNIDMVFAPQMQVRQGFPDKT
jgi:hypothetical protein